MHLSNKSSIFVVEKETITTKHKKIMKKKYALCLVHTIAGDKYMIMDKTDYCTAMCKCDIIFESDNFMEVMFVTLTDLGNWDNVDFIRFPKTITTMKVKELIEILKNIDENTNVFCWDNRGGGYTLTDVEYNEDNNQVELS